ncbi:intraflagellar transporter IFT43 [Salpingoeca rosetta]|uniref:Intraflagellar transporter IFT43 n=1 Tax=Salpingoeca rosetta (strain ATCC 50818 / BSB-021) TaxID=946362 RepID=F2U1Z6_SALR5|nr:intraflagellar transporter IFT43 [Salpingoeca rosetta]EGD81648.1 intraflagellar transporter IFT43 [Salpingoeca rosetta]|eukprot:XP_004996852.1 intraflagellar transporter IFT43 [Salpingoeca rosetta]
MLSFIKVVDNQPFDEVYEVDDPEEIASNLAHSPSPSRALVPDRPVFEPGNTPPRSPSTAGRSEYDGDVAATDMEDALGLGRTSQPDVAIEDDSDSQSEQSQSSSELDGSTLAPKLEGAYDPTEYSSLNVGDEIQDLFEHITSFEPEVLELETKLKPFIPEYIPAVGDIDAFLKIPRPDGVDQGLGLVVLDEPCAAQSDATVLDLHLRTIAKTTSSKPTKLNQIKDAEQDTKAIDTWVTSIAEVHRDKQPQTVHYTGAMPDLESLMQEWPPQMEALLDKVQLPSGDLNVSLQEMTDIACALLDIPVHKSRIESLHLLFSLFAEFKNSQHFKAEEEEDDDADEAAGEDIATFD